MRTFLSYLSSAAPVLLAALVLALPAYFAAAAQIRRRGGTPGAGRRVYIYVTAAYAFALLGLLVFRQGRPGDMRALNLELFLCYREAARGFRPLDMINILMNILIFLPFGFLAALPLGGSGKRRLVIPAGFALSLLVELVQYLTARGIADVDDLFNNTLGAACGYALARFVLLLRAGRPKRGVLALLLALACLSPPFAALAVSAASPYGATGYEPYGGEALAGREISFSAGASAFLARLAEDPPAAYFTSGGSLEDAYAAADAFFGRFGLGRSAQDETLYDDDAWLYSEGREYFLRYEYNGPALWYRRMGARDAGGSAGRYTEADARAAAAAWGVEIPEGAAASRGEDGSFVFSLAPGGGLGGSVAVRLAGGAPAEIVSRLYALEPAGTALPLGEAEAAAALGRGDYYCRDTVPEGDIAISSASIEYALDSKGAYRPVLLLLGGECEFRLPLAIE